MKPIFTTLLFIFIAGTMQAQVKSALEASADEKFKITHGPYLQHLDETRVIIMCVTNRNATSWVELAPDDSTNFYKLERPKYFSATDGLKNVSTIHTVRIDDLQPGKKYRYRIFLQEVLSHEGIEVRYGRIVASRVYQRKAPEFRSNDSRKGDISFLMLNDIHERNEVMKNLLKGTDWENTDLVVFNGDMVNSSRSEQQIFASFMDTAVSLFAGETPMYYARGNHETRGPFASAFSKYFPGVDGKLYYMFRQGPVCFIILDSGEDKPDSDIEYSGITAFDTYRDEQAKWLAEAVRSKTFLDAPFKVAIAHIPPIGGWHGQMQVAEKFIPLLNKAGIDIMLCAHLHRYVRSEKQAGIRNFPIVVNSNNTILKVKADNNQLKVDVVDVKGAIVDSLVINKK